VNEMTAFNVLIVDDEIDFMETLIKRMKKRDVNIDGVGSGAAALEALDQKRIDLVVLDVRMPGMDGLETLKRIKARHPLIEVIMLTGTADVDTAVKGMELGAFDYLMKPMDIDELLYTLEDAYLQKTLKEKGNEKEEE